MGRSRMFRFWRTEHFGKVVRSLETYVGPSSISVAIDFLRSNAPIVAIFTATILFRACRHFPSFALILVINQLGYGP